jgi:hypothetical protein
MTTGWVAAALRGRSLTTQLLGQHGQRELASAPSWPRAVEMLAATVYGTELAPDADRAATRLAAANSTAWQLRVFAGWVPPSGRGIVRVAAAPLEIFNVEQHLRELSGGDQRAPILLGSLASAWPRIERCATPETVREALAVSVWSDPGGNSPSDIALGMRTAWVRRAVHYVPSAKSWALGYLAVLAARELYSFDREIAATTGRHVDRLLGKSWRRAATLAEFRDGLAPAAAWPLAEVKSAGDLWRGEVAVRRQVAMDAARLAARNRFDQRVIVGVVGLLLSDLYGVLAAVETAGRSVQAIEVFDAVA